MRFRSLDFIITKDGELTQTPGPAQFSRSDSLDTIIKALEELQLCTLEARASGSGQPLSPHRERLKRQLDALMGPQPSPEGLHRLSSSLANVMA